MTESERREVKRILTAIFCFCAVAFTSTRALSLFGCARQLQAAGLPVDPLGHVYGALTPLLSFPLNLMPEQRVPLGADLPLLFRAGMVLNSVLAGLACACFVIACCWLLAGRQRGREARRESPASPSE